MRHTRYSIQNKYRNNTGDTYMGVPITREEHEEFARRQDEENKRQNRRLDALEKDTEQINALVVSVEKMAVNMENMLSAIERQGNLIEKQNDRLDEIENKPAQNYEQIKMLVITTLISAVVGGLASQLLTFL